MPAALHCPQCGHTMPRYDWRRDETARQLGLCVDCRQPVTPEDRAAGRWRCVACRQRRAVAMQRTRAAA